MSKQAHARSVTRFVYAGMNGPYSLIPLQRLLQQGLRPQAVLLPQATPPRAGASLLPVEPPDTPFQLHSLAEAYDLPVFYCPHNEALEAATGPLRPAVVLVAGWPRRIPENLLDGPAQGWLNLHPSLLPAYRGPAPLFWQLRDGARLGVSLHRMDSGLDTGPIVAQAECPCPDGESLAAIETRLAEVGAGLFSRVLTASGQGLELTPQASDGACQQGWPTPRDYGLDTRTDARTAYNFFTAMLSAGRPCRLQLPDRMVSVQAATAWHGNRLTILSEQAELDIEMGVG